MELKREHTNLESPVCGRFTRQYTWAELHALYALSSHGAKLPEGFWEKIEKRWKHEFGENWRDSFNIAPTQLCPILRSTSDSVSVDRLRWGLVPFWASDEKIGASLVNGRAETAFEKPAFRDAMKKRRCLIPASGFYEWRTIDAKEKQPYYFRPRSRSPFFIAGLWETWGPMKIETFTLLTREADSIVSPVHHRMPVILSPADVDAWMDPHAEPDQLRAVLAPRQSDLETFPVSKLVNAVRNDSPDLIAPAPPMSLF